MTTPVLLASRTRRGASVVITAEGEADTVTAPVLRRELSAALEELDEADVLVVDATGVTFIDSTGLAELIRANQHCESRRLPMRLVTSPELYRILELTGLIEVFHITDSVDSALTDGDES